MWTRHFTLSAVGNYMRSIRVLSPTCMKMYWINCEDFNRGENRPFDQYYVFTFGTFTFLKKQNDTQGTNNLNFLLPS